jgi:hypothetical protein
VSTCFNTSSGNCTSTTLLGQGGYTSLQEACNTTASGFSLSPSSTVNLTHTTAASVVGRSSRSGCFLFTYSLSGARSGSFSRPFPQLLYVHDSDVAIAGPLLTSARFSDAGTQLMMDFEGATDGAGLKGVFPCSRVVGFRGVSTSECFWATGARLIASLDRLSTVRPGENVTLRAGVVRAECPSGVSCVAWPSSVVTSVIILPPLSPTTPEVTLVAPASVSYCGDLSIDGSAAKGGLGRPLYRYWTVHRQVSRSGYIGQANITNHLRSFNFNSTWTSDTGRYGASTLTIPSRLLTRGSTYKLVLSVTNFLGVSGDSTPAYIAVTGGRANPEVAVTPSQLTVYRGEAVRVFANATLPRCSAATALNITWSGLSSSSTSGIIGSSSADRRFFRVEANRLTPGVTYVLNVTVRDDLGGIASSSSTVTVLASPLAVRIAGGDRVVGGSGPVMLDASLSYDPDVGSSSALTLDYAWSCVKGGEDYGKGCGVSSAVLTGVSPTIRRLATGVYIFTVTGSKGSRSASASVTIRVTGASLPGVTVSQVVKSSLGGAYNRVNPTDKLALEGWADFRNVSQRGLNVSLAWAVASGSLANGDNLADSAKSATSLTVTEGYISGYGTDIVGFPLVLPGGAMVGGAAYTFRLQAVDKSGPATTTTAAYGEITVVTNAPPAGGAFGVAPARGVVLVTRFSLAMTHWEDDPDDYPLSYGFEYASNGAAAGGVFVLAHDAYTPFLSGVYFPEVHI